MLLADAGHGVSVAVLALVILVVLALLALFFAALVSILRTPQLSPAGRLVWIVAILVFQFFGPVAWFVFGRRTAALL